MRWLVAAALVAACGCAPSVRRYFPLEVGNRWSYAVRSGFLSRVEDIEVVRSLSVAGTTGFEVRGPTGVSRLAWTGSTLVAESLPGMRYSPPLPLLDPSRPKAPRVWKGLMTSPTAVLEAEARIVPQAATLTLGGRRYETLHVVATIRSEGRSMELQTWYAPGIGVLRQEQRSNDNLVRSLEYLAGP